MPNLKLCAAVLAVELVDMLVDELDQGSPTFLKPRATSWVLINAKGYQFDTHLNKLPEIANLLNLPLTLLLLIITDIYLCENTDYINDFSQQIYRNR